MIRRLSNFFLVFMLPVVLIAQQPSIDYSYHSSLEQNVIEGYLNDSNTDMLALQMIADETAKHEDIYLFNDILTEFVNPFVEKKDRYGTERLVKTVFYKVHKKFLKNYTAHSTLKQTLENGKYDCLSGTTLYSLIFDRLGVSYEVVETNYHIYMKVKDGNKLLLVEPTDPIYGFVSDQKEVSQRMTEYEEDNKVTTSKNQYVYNMNMHNEIGLNELAGLHYYNVSVSSFNNSDLNKAIACFEKASIFYNSSRLVEFGNVLSQNLLIREDINDNRKRALLSRLNEVMSVGVSVAVR